MIFSLLFVSGQVLSQLTVNEAFGEIKLSQDCQNYFKEQLNTLSRKCQVEASEFKGTESLVDTFSDVLEVLPNLCATGCQNALKSSSEALMGHPCAKETIQTKSGPMKVTDLLEGMKLTNTIACVKSNNEFCLQQQKKFLLPAMGLANDTETLQNNLLGVVIQPTFFCTQCMLDQLKAVAAAPPQSEQERKMINSAKDLSEAHPKICSQGATSNTSQVGQRVQRREVTNAPSATATQKEGQTVTNAPSGTATQKETVPVAHAAATQHAAQQQQSASEPLSFAMTVFLAFAAIL